MKDSMDIRKRKISLFNAILALENLIKNGITKESDYQHCFEENPIIFESLGYTEFYAFTKEAKEQLPRDSYSGLQPEPDFIVKNSHGIYEIFELKTPVDKKLSITSNNYRERFTAELNSYISQTMTYNDYFTRNPENRKIVEELFDIKIQEDIPQTIIYGLKKNVDVNKIHKLASRFRDKIAIITYSKILENLERSYSFLQGEEEGIKGYSIHTILRCDRNQYNDKKNYIFDIARENKKDRLSIFFDQFKNLSFEIYTSDSVRYSISLSNLQVDVFDRFSYVTFELGVLDDMFFLSTFVDAKEIEKRYIYLPIKIDLSNLNAKIGCSHNIDQYGKFQLGKFALNNYTMTFRDRTYLYHLMKMGGSTLSFHGDSGYVEIQNFPKMEKKPNPEPLPLILYGVGESKITEDYMKFLNAFVYPIDKNS